MGAGATSTATEPPRLHLVLAESALELVPEALWSHPAVAKSARARNKRPRDIILDDTHHHAAMRALAKKGLFAEPERRGRPDIIHLSLLVALESRLNLEGGLRVWVHTRDDRWITVAPEVHLQRAQHRFMGLMENLLASGRVPPDLTREALLRVENDVTLLGGVQRIGAAHVVVMDAHGETSDDALEPLLTEPLAAGGDVAVIVGGYPRGELKSDLSALSPRTVQLGAEPLVAWTVIAELVVRCHRDRARRGSAHE